MMKITASGLLLASLLLAGAATAAEKKDKTVLDLKAVQQDNVSPNPKHSAMGSLGERVHGGAFGPWRCQVKIRDRREMNVKMKEADKDGRVPSTHMLSLSVIDPGTGKGVTAGTATATVTGPDKKKAKSELQQVGGPFLADIDLQKAGEYSVQIEFASGKQKAAAKFSYTVK